MPKKLAVCFFVIACALALCACGSEKYETKANPVFSADIDYGSDRKARKEFLEEIQKLLEEKIKYGDEDIVAMYGDPSILDAHGNRRVYAFEIKTEKSAEMLFRCVNGSKSISDVSNSHPDKEQPNIVIGENLWCNYDCVDIKLPQSQQYVCIRFSERDSRALYKYIQKACRLEMPPDYSSDAGARRELVEELIAELDSKIDYGERDRVSVRLDEGEAIVTRVELRSRETAQMLFDAMRNCRTIIDYTGAVFTSEPSVFFIGEEGLGNYRMMFFDLPPAYRYAGLYFRAEDTQALEEYMQEQGSRFLPKNRKDSGYGMDELKEELLKALEEQLVYGEKDELTMCYDREKRYIERADILTEESAELLFDCVKTCWSFSDVTGLDLEEEHMPLVINGKPIGNFDYLYLDYPPTGSRVAIELDWQYADALYEHLFAQGSDELHRDSWGNIMPPTKTGERIAP